MGAGGSCSALNDTNTMLGYAVVLTATRRNKFPSDTVTTTHIRECLINELAAIVGTDCFYVSMVLHVTRKLLKLPDCVGYLLQEVIKERVESSRMFMTQ